MTREAILEATADQVVERGPLDFSIPDIAKRAGVSHRTVYNYFADRQALLREFTEWLSAQFASKGGYNSISALEQMPDAIRVNFRLFGEMGDLYRAFAKVDSSENDIYREDRKRRTEMFLTLAREEFTHLSDERVVQVMMLLRSMGSSRFWYSLTVERGLTSDEAGDVAAWAIKSLLETVKAENGEAARQVGGEDI